MMIRLVPASFALLVLTACGGSDGPKVENAADLMKLAEKAGVECPGEWRQADNDQVMGLLGADDVYRCGDFYDDPNQSDEEYVIVATFPDEEARDAMASNLASDDGPEGLRTFVSDSWLLASADADKMASAADGEMLN